MYDKKPSHDTDGVDTRGMTVYAHHSYDEVVTVATRRTVAALTAMKNDDRLPELAVAARMVVDETNEQLAAHAKAKQARRDEAAGDAGEASNKKERTPLRILEGPLPRQAAEILMIYRPVVLIQAIESNTARDTALLAVYNAAEGLHEECSGRSNPLTVALREMAFTATDRWLGEAMSALRDLAPLRYQTADADLVPLDDCVYNRVTGDREPYDPEKHVYLAKARTRLPASEPELPRIQNPDGSWWDPQSWLEQTMGSAALATAIHEVNAYLLCNRAFTDDKVVAYLAESGSNGKGTLLALQRAIVGGPRGIACASLGLDVFDGKREFLLTRLMGASANLSDESDSDTFMASSAAVKAISSHDPIQINRKNRDPVEVRLFVPMIFSLNRMPKIKDKTEAVERRLHIIRFNQRFMREGTAIKKNSLIKSDYILRDEVREWFVWQALVALGPITEFAVPDDIAAALEEYRGTNDHVIGFWRKYAEDFDMAMNLPYLPIEFLHNFYAADAKATRGSNAAVEGEREFKNRITEEAVRSGVWLDERDNRGDRRKLSFKSWAKSGHNQAVGLIVEHLAGSRTYRTENFGTVRVQERIVGDRALARWTRSDVSSASSAVELAAPDIPWRGHALVRNPAYVPDPDRAAERPQPSQPAVLAPDPLAAARDAQSLPSTAPVKLVVDTLIAAQNSDPRRVPLPVPPAPAAGLSQAQIDTSTVDDSAVNSDASDDMWAEERSADVRPRLSPAQLDELGIPSTTEGVSA